MLDSRLSSILRELMTAETPITGKYLASINQVTTRTTRDDIKHLDATLKDHGASIQSIMGQGYELTILDDQKYRKFLQEHVDVNKETKTVPRTPEERISYMIRRLLLFDGYCKLEDLADELYVSRSTVQNDLKEVKKILNNYDIELVSRPNYGMKVSGGEVNLRYCIAEYIFDRRTEGEQLNNLNLPAITKEHLQLIQQTVLIQVKENEITLSDKAMQNLLIHIAIAVKRIESGNHITMLKADTQEIMEEREYLVAQKIVTELEETFDITFPQTEVAYIAIHLLGTKMLSQTNTGEDIVEQVIDEDIVQLIKNALEKIEAKLNLDIKNDKELMIGLALHLKPAVNRYKFGMNIRNPMLAEIKKNYPLAFEAGLVAGMSIEEQTGMKINESEIGYLALHIGAAIERIKLRTQPKRCLIVCASGLGTAQLIFYRLKNHFGQSLDVVGTTEYYNLNQYRFNNIDFIVSSIPIEQNLQVPIIEVNAIIGEKDLMKIERFLVDSQTDVEKYFREDLLFLQKNFSSMHEVLDFLNDELRNRNLVDGDFLDAIYQREKVAPTAFGNLVAIPHPIAPKSRVTFLAVCTLQKPISWQTKPVQLVCVLCVKKGSEEELQPMYDLLGKIIDSSTLVQQILRVKTYEEFIHVLSD